jgi:hypothetical protein
VLVVGEAQLGLLRGGPSAVRLDLLEVSGSRRALLFFLVEMAVDGHLRLHAHGAHRPSSAAAETRRAPRRRLPAASRTRAGST